MATYGLAANQGNEYPFQFALSTSPFIQGHLTSSDRHHHTGAYHVHPATPPPNRRTDSL